MRGGNWFGRDTDAASRDDERKMAKKRTMAEDGAPSLVGCVAFCEQRFGRAPKISPTLEQVLREQVTIQFGLCAHNACL